MIRPIKIISEDLSMRLLTGIQPTNILHIGNLFGALIPAVQLQKEHELFMMIADYHAITITHNPEDLQKSILLNAAAYIAAGINPTKSVLFQQSQIPEHTELAWILQTQTRIGELKRMTQFKDKAGKKIDNVSVGLFTYPVLMASDILLYQAEGVPVGDDQKQHVELTRDIAQRFNHTFGKVLTMPKPLIRKHGARIKSLSDPEKKMSKSAASAKSYISLLDDKDIMHKKIRSAVTDSQKHITFDPNRAGLYNLLTIFSLCTGTSSQELAHTYAQSGMKILKDDLTQALWDHLEPIQKNIQELMNNEDELKRIINNGSAHAQQTAKETLQKVKKHIGIHI